MTEQASMPTPLDVLLDNIDVNDSVLFYLLSYILK